MLQINQDTQVDSPQGSKQRASLLNRRPSFSKPAHVKANENLGSGLKSPVRSSSIRLNPINTPPKGLDHLDANSGKQNIEEIQRQFTPQLGTLKLYRSSRLLQENSPNVMTPNKKPQAIDPQEPRTKWRISTLKNNRLASHNEPVKALINGNREGVESTQQQKFQMKDAILPETSSGSREKLCFYLQNLQSSTRERIMQTPGTRFGGTFAQVGDKFFFFGGETRKKDLSGVSCFDTATGVWRAIEAVNEGPSSRRTGHSAFGYRDKSFIFGGQESADHSEDSEECLKDLWSFDPNQRMWFHVQTNSQILEARSHHASCVHDSKFIINGGVSQSGKYLSDTWILDLETKQWQLAEIKDNNQNGHNTSDNCAYHRMCAVFADSKHPNKLAFEGYYSFGGVDPRRTELSDNVRVLIMENKNTSSWRTLECKGKKPAGRMFHSLEYYPGLQSLILYGGKDKNDNFLGGICALNLQTLCWISVKVVGESLNRPRAGQASLIFGSQLWIAGGSTSDNGRQSFLSRFELDQVAVEQLQKPEDFESMELHKDEKITDFCQEITRIWDLIDEKIIDPEHEEAGYLYSIPEDDDAKIFRLGNEEQAASPIRRQSNLTTTLSANVLPRTHSASTQIRINHHRTTLKSSSSYNSRLPMVKEIAGFLKNNGSGSIKKNI